MIMWVLSSNDNIYDLYSDLITSTQDPSAPPLIESAASTNDKIGGFKCNNILLILQELLGQTERHGEIGEGRCDASVSFELGRFTCQANALISTTVTRVCCTTHLQRI